MANTSNQFAAIQRAIQQVMGPTPVNSPYGNTIGWYNMSPTMALEYGVDAVADDILVRITTPYLWFDPTFGYDVTQLVNAASANPTVLLGPLLRQINLDSRVANCNGSSANWDSETNTLTLTVIVNLTSGQTFNVIGSISTLNPSQFQFSYVVSPSPS
jgi:hypothetical protein